MRNGLLVGLTAGLVSAIVLIAAMKGSVLGLFAFIFLAPLPIIIAGLGWGWPSALFAASSAALAMLAFLHPRAALFHFIAIGLPMVLCSYLLMLNRETETRDADGTALLEWYPPGRVLGVLTLLAGGLAALSLLSMASNENQLEEIIRARIDELGLNLPEQTDTATFVKLMTNLFTPIAGTFWLMLASFNLWLGGLVTRASGQLGRPWPDLSLMELPRETPIVLVASVGLSFIDGYPGLIALGFTSVLFFAYLIIGMAILHNITRGIGGRPFIIGAIYFSMIIFYPFSWIIVSMIGISEPVSPLRRHSGTPDKSS